MKGDNFIVDRMEELNFKKLILDNKFMINGEMNPSDDKS
jgi:hypothetical protein